MFASIVKTVFPTTAVKYFTVWFKDKEGRGWHKENAKERAQLFLPGVAKEVRAIQKMQFTEDQLRHRVWSDGTCTALLEQGDTSLWFLAKSNEAYDLIIKDGNASVIAKTFRINTPSVSYLKKWLGTASRDVVLAVIAKAPSIFNDLKYGDVKLEYISSLVKSSDASVSERWANKVFLVLVGRYLNAEEKEEREVFDKAMKLLVQTGYDFTQSLRDLESNHWDWYDIVRVHASMSSSSQKEHLVSYIKERIPKVWYSFVPLGERELDSFENRSYHGENWKRVHDSRAWLQLAYETLSNQEVVKVCLDHISSLTYGKPCGAIVKMQERLVKKVQGYELTKYALSKMPKQYKSELQSKLFKSISSYDEARECIKSFPKSYRKGLRAKMAEVVCIRDAHEFIRTYWPFTNWEPENAEASVRRLAQIKMLPLDRLNELSEELQRIGLEEVDITAEQECLLIDPYEYSSPAATQNELLKRQLHPRSEGTLFTRGYHWQDVKLEYISNFKMSEMGFQALVNHRGSYCGDGDRGRELVQAHAKKWGLTKREYLLLYKSPYYSELAAPLRDCNPAEASAEEKAEEPNNDEKSE